VSALDLVPWRTHMLGEDFYAGLDAGIRLAVRVIHAAGIDTCQSCQGGEGHAYDQPSIDLCASGHDARGFAVLSALTDYGLDVAELQLVWNVKNGLPYEQLWRVTLVRAYPERAEERPIFVHGYQAAELVS